MVDKERFVVLSEEFPRELAEDADAVRPAAYSLWLNYLAESGGAPVSDEADIAITISYNMIDRSYVGIRVIGWATKNPFVPSAEWTDDEWLRVIQTFSPESNPRIAEVAVHKWREEGPK